jgi:hypothetical protein
MPSASSARCLIKAAGACAAAAVVIGAVACAYAWQVYREVSAHGDAANWDAVLQSSDWSGRLLAVSAAVLAFAALLCLEALHRRNDCAERS